MEMNKQAQIDCLQAIDTENIIEELKARNIYGILWQAGKGIIMCTEMPTEVSRHASVLGV